MNEINCKISDAEWTIMKELWNKSPLTSTEIIKTLKTKTDWNPKTIHTLIDRLVKKEVIGVNKDCTQYEFYPLVDKNDCILEETKSFIQKVYDGSFHLMLTNFIKEKKLSSHEIEELQKLLDDKLTK